MAVASPVELCGPSFSSIVLLDLFPIISLGLRDLAQKPYSGSPGLVRLNIVLVAIPFARTHSSALQSWSVTPVISKMSSSARMQLPPPHPMTTAFVGSIGAASNEWARDLSVSDWVGVNGRQVGSEGDFGEYREG